MNKSSRKTVHRRTALRAGAAAAAATGGALIASSSSAQAATGQAVVQGASNVVGAPTTFLFSSGATPTLQVRNTGTGAAAFFFGQNNNGFAGGTGSGSKYGLSAANTGAAGRGAGLAASGNNNTGVLANTANEDRFAVEATNLSEAAGVGGAVLADGGAGVGVVATNVSVDAPALVVDGGAVAFGDLVLADGAVAVTTVETNVFYGALSGDGSPTVQFSGTATAESTGQAILQLDPEAREVCDFSQATVMLTPRSGPMPNLYGTVDTGAIVAIFTGTWGGRVGFLVTVPLKGFAVPEARAQAVGAGGLQEAVNRARAARPAR